ncbi:MAG TPA: AI-2E family transporter [Blastocatellia bacterium]|nr:AI-2E family transporter [Blastocatellia bacterium]
MKRRITLGFLIALAVFALYLCYIIFNPFIRPFLSAVVIAVVFFPVHARLARLVASPSLAALISTVLVILIVVLPAVLIGIAFYKEAASLYSYLDQKSEESGGLGTYVMRLIEGPMRWLSQYVDVSQFNLGEWLRSRLQSITQFLVNEAGGLLGNITLFLINSVIALFTLFFLFREGRSMRRRAAAILPLSSEQVDRLFTGIENTIIATVYGGIVVAIAQGFLTGLALWITGIHSPVLWGVVAAFFALLPLVGTAVVWIPAAIYLFATGSWGKGLFLIAWGAAFVGTVDNFLRPYLMSGRVRMHTLLIFFAVFGGVQAFGFLGLFIGPVILAVTITVLGMLRDEGRIWKESWEFEAAPAPVSSQPAARDE